MPMNPGENRRKFSRVDLSDNPIPCEVRIIDVDAEHVPLPAGTRSYLLNLSTGGARFNMTGFVLPNIDNIHCTVQFTLQGRVFQLKGEIRWKQVEPKAEDEGIFYDVEWTGPTTTYGVSWMGLTDEEKELLREALLKEYDMRLTMRINRHLTERHLDALREASE